MTECIDQLRFGFHPNRDVVATFDAPETSSDGGLLLLRALDERMGLTRAFAERIPDRRDPRFTVHPRLEQLRQRVYQIAMGYEDCNDATRLREDRMFKLACEQLPDSETALSSQPTLSRLDNDVPMGAIKPLLLSLEDGFVQSLSKRRKLVVLDIDPTDDPTHGGQQLTFFHGYYDTHMYFPLLVFDGQTGDLASAVLRPGNVGATRGAVGIIDRLVRAVRRRCRRALILVRADSAFATPEFLAKLDELSAELSDVRYVIGLAKNNALLEVLRPWMVIAQAWYEHTQKPARRFIDFWRRAGRWKYERRIIGKAEHLPQGPNPRFVVTNLDDDAEAVYETYCGRGQAENFIKAFKNAVHGDRLSCSRFAANFFRLLLHALAYRLLRALAANVQRVAPSMPVIQLDTLRLRLLKVAAVVTQSVRRILVRLPCVYPYRELFSAVAGDLRPAPS
jgi:hypothetical protein